MAKTQKQNAAIAFLASPFLLHVTMPFVIVYLTLGTVAQKYMGLYRATEMFFADYIIHLSAFPIPLPGFPILMGILCVNMVFKLAVKSQWSLRHSGIIIAHISVIFLLAGGLITALFSQEGFVDLSVGQTKNYITDYHVREFIVTKQGSDVLGRWDHQSMSVGQVLQADNAPFSVRVLETCRHCKIEARQISEDDQRTYYSMAQFMTLKPDALRAEDESNMGGVTFEALDKNGDIIGVFTAVEEVPKWPQIDVDDKVYEVQLQKQHKSLPFKIELLDFERELYPGTQKAKSYQSHVRITDERGSWDSMISMNQPLRYRGYTFFQSSFMRTEAGDISVLAVVWNLGRSFPYIAGLILALGLIVHLVVRKR